MELKYDAFISYRHAELDKFVAEVLHKELESFRLPKSITKKWEAKEERKTKINRVFRDRDELPIASNLADPIVRALETSDFLIVICTPRLPESIWCKTEIETFIKLHGRDKVLAVLAEGEPAESFPQAILYDENGRPVEPLAADVRGKTHKEIKKKIKEEVIRLAAPMFDCAYDELKQRHRERKMKRILTASLAGATVCFAFGAVSTTMALRIHTQSLEIEKQAVKIEEQYTQALETNAKSMAADSLRLLDEGDRIGAIQTALAALPDGSENEMPYTPQAQYALTESLYVYENGYQILPKHVLKQEAQVEFMKLSPNGDRLLSVDFYGKIYVWDVLNEKKISEVVPQTIGIGIIENQIAFLDNDTFVFPQGSGFAIYSIAKSEIIYQNSEDMLGAVYVSDQKELFAVLSYDFIKVFNTTDYKEIYEWEKEEKSQMLYKMDFSDKEKQIVFAQKKEEKEAEIIEVYLVDLLTKEVQTVKSFQDVSLQQLMFDQEELFVAVNKQSETKSTIFDQYTGMLYVYQVQNQIQPSWSYLYEKGMINEIKTMKTEEKELVLFSGYGYLGILDRNTGGKIDEYEYGETIVDFYPYPDTNLIGLMTRRGEYHFINTKSMVDVVEVGKFKTVSDNMKDFITGKGFYASLPYGETAIHIYTRAQGENTQKVYEGKEHIRETVISKTRNEIIFVKDKLITLFDTKEEKIIQEIAVDDMIMGVTYTGNEEDTILIALANKILFYKTSDGKKIKEVETDETLYDLKVFLQDGEELAFYKYQGIHFLDTQTGKIKEIIECEEDMQALGVYAIGEKGDSYAIASKKDKAIKLFVRGEEACIGKIPANTHSISYLNFSKEDSQLYVTYIDGKVELYDVNKRILLKTFTQINKEVKKVVYDVTTGYSYLQTIEDAYVINQENELIARIDALKAILPNEKKYLMDYLYEIYTVPMYDLEQLVKIAKEQSLN